MDDLAARRDALRQAATAPEADPWTLLEAALTELDGAVEALGEAETAQAGELPASRAPDGLQAERRLLRAAFQDAPAALLLLAANGTVRRASNKAAALLGTPVGYATGKPLTVFVDLPQRAAVQTQLAAVARSGEPREISCRVLTPDGLADVTLAVTALDLPGDRPVLAATITPRDPAATPKRRPARSDEAGGGTRHVASMARRLDMVTALTRQLLDNTTFSETVTLQRCARLLAGAFADWAIVDVAADGGLRRQVVAGPRGAQDDQVARGVREVAPGPSTLPGQVHATGKSVLLAHATDPGALGAGADGTPLLMTLRAASLLVVPISDGTDSYGVLTLIRDVSSGHFTLADLALAEDLARLLATAMRVDQMFRRRFETAQALRASLLPERLPEVPGLELAASYAGAARPQEINGDFCDVFRVPSGWAVAIGDVSGTGYEATAMSIAARHTLRVLAHVHRDPADVLAAASEILVSGCTEERFVTAMVAFADTAPLEKGDGRCQVRLATAGHPGPAVVRGDGRAKILAGDGFPLGLALPESRSEGPARMDIELDAGDMMLFYTDGVSQAPDENAEFFDDRLTSALAGTVGWTAAETVHALSEQLTEFRRGEPREDVTLLVMRVC